MPGWAMRGAIGFCAAVLAVLIFHQGMWAALNVANLPGLGMPRPYPMDAVPPLGIPRIVNLCFWGGLYGIAFGLLFPRIGMPSWLAGLLFGVLAALVGLFVVPAIKGLPVGGGWEVLRWVRSFLINGAWGLGLGLIFPTLFRSFSGRSPAGS